MKYIYLLILLFGFSNDIDTNKYIITFDEIDFPKMKIKEEKEEVKQEEILDVFNSTITAYEPFCIGCSGITASGYNVKETDTYNDNEYGIVNVLAADSLIPFGSIIKFNINNIDYKAIVLDRGGAIGFNSYSQFDLLFKNEEDAINFGVHENIKFEILRYGF